MSVYSDLEEFMHHHRPHGELTWWKEVVMAIAITVALALVAAFASVSPVFAQQSARLPVDALRGGGHVILMRYGAVEMVQEPSPIDLANCGVQHRLTDKGRDQARKLGETFRELNIRVGQVLSSQYCRALEYARLAFGSAQPAEVLLHPKYPPVGPACLVPPPFEQRLEALKQLLATSPAAGTNTVLVTHGLVVRGATGFDMATGEAAIFRPDGRGGTTLVTRVLLDQWR